MANGDPNPSAPDKLKATERRASVLEFRKQGKTVRAIAAALGVGVATVHRDLMAELRALNRQTRETADELRRLELERLDALLEKAWALLDNATVSFPALMTGIIKLSERRSKLLGLDAPSKQELTGKDGGPLHIKREQESEIAATLYNSFRKHGDSHEQASERLRWLHVSEGDIPAENGEPLINNQKVTGDSA